MQLSKYKRFFHTVRYLKFIQIRYQLWYRLKNKILKRPRYKNPFGKGKPFIFKNEIKYNESYNRKTFEFLNQSHNFKTKIDWNFSEKGKLWTYNLNYFDFLHQESMSKEEGLFLIEDYIDNYDHMQDGHEPYPTSLRIINWVKFIGDHSISEKRIDDIIGEDVYRLTKNIEYHILGNHLLENAFALIFASYYFRNEELYFMGYSILKKELNEQILKDGAHFELSPMYHSLILWRLLDISLLLDKNQFMIEGPIDKLIREKSRIMMSWLNKIYFSDGTFPHFNDSTDGIAPDLKSLRSHTSAKHLRSNETELKDSGYRKLQCKKFEVLLDIGKVGPDYIPAHSHCDTLSFSCFIDGKPLIVDVGVSTYEKNERRNWERSTTAHNTVQVGNFEQSDIYGGFRLGKRACTKIYEDTCNKVSASHDGYADKGYIHRRTWKLEKNRLIIKDTMKGELKEESNARFYFHTECNPRIVGNTVRSEKTLFSFDGFSNIDILEIEMPCGYNKFVKSKCVEVSFHENLVTTIS